MNPQQQYTPPQSQYDFIVNPGGPPKKTLLPSLGGHSSFTQRLIIIIGGAVILIIAMWVVGNLLGGGGVNTASLTKLVQQQEEIARVAGAGSESSRSDIRNAATTVKLSLASQQQRWLQFLANQGTEVGDEQQQALQNAAADQQLEQAKSNNSFDKTFVDLMRAYLNEYAAAIQVTFDQSGSNSERELLRSHFEQVKLLQEQLPKT